MSNTRNYLGQDINTKNLAPSASESQKGLIEIATTAEAKALMDNTRAMTPASIASIIATTAQAQGLTDDKTIITPKKLADAFDENVFGYGQTETNVTGSRTLGQTYFNTTKKPIIVRVAGSPSNTDAMLQGRVNATTVQFAVASPLLTPIGISFVVLPGESYSVSQLNTTSNFSWQEVR